MLQKLDFPKQVQRLPSASVIDLETMNPLLNLILFVESFSRFEIKILAKYFSTMNYVTTLTYDAKDSQ